MGKGHGVSGYTHTQKQLDNYANRHNPNNHAYHANLENHSNQCNPNNDEYYRSREGVAGLKSDITPDLLKK